MKGLEKIGGKSARMSVSQMNELANNAAASAKPVIQQEQSSKNNFSIAIPDNRLQLRRGDETLRIDWRRKLR